MVPIKARQLVDLTSFLFKFIWGSLLLPTSMFRKFPMCPTSLAMSSKCRCVLVHQATNLITKKELLTMDPDTEDGQLLYQITTEPKHGFLESKLNPGSPITTFTQGTLTHTHTHAFVAYRPVLFFRILLFISRVVILDVVFF